MRLAIQIVAALIVITATAVLGYRLGTGRGPRSMMWALLGATPAAAAPLNVATITPPTDTPTQLPIATQTPVQETATPIPRVTLPPVFTPTPVKPTPVPQQRQTSSSANSQNSPSSVPAIIPSATRRPANTATPTFTPTSTPTATPTPQYDFIVVELREIPRPEYRDTAIIRGRLIDQKGNPVPGAYFQIDSDGTPKFEAVEPHGATRVDGTATFVVTKGRFAVRVLGGRSEYAGWMVTGRTGVGPMSDWEFTFQTTRAIPAGTLVSPTSTPPPTPTP